MGNKSSTPSSPTTFSTTSTSTSNSVLYNTSIPGNITTISTTWTPTSASTSYTSTPSSTSTPNSTLTPSSTSTLNSTSTPSSNSDASVDDGAIANLKPGDLIKIKRNTLGGLRVFYHFAVYLGDDYVIHLIQVDGEYCKCPDHVPLVSDNPSTKCRDCGKRYKSVVVSEPLKTVLNIGSFTVANDLDSKYSPLPEDKIIANAKSILGPVDYNLRRCNCEHIAYWCRYGVPDSFQSLIKRHTQTNVKTNNREALDETLKSIEQCKLGH